MTEESRPVIDLNTANRETLMQLHGVGSKMALRIIAARPFASVDDLQRVNGISAAFLEGLRPLVAVSEPVESDEETPEAAPQPKDEFEPSEMAPQPEAESPPEGEAIPSEGANQFEAEVIPAEAEIQPEVEDEPFPKEAPISKEPALVSRTQAFWMAFGVGALAFILALVLSLGILANLNGGSLQFVSPSQLNELTRATDELNARIDTLDQGVEGLRTRLDNLDALSKNVSAVEQATEQLQSDIDGLSTQVKTLQTQNDRFQGFLSGLRDLVDDLLQPEEEK